MGLDKQYDKVLAPRCGHKNTVNSLLSLEAASERQTKKQTKPQKNNTKTFHRT